MKKPKQLKKPMNMDVIESFVARLTAALGKEPDFTQVLAALVEDSSISQPMLVDICKRFYGDANSKTSKSEALRRIKLRHSSLMDFRAKSRAQSGKSAA